jgi:hypothetical protein
VDVVRKWTAQLRLARAALRVTLQKISWWEMAKKSRIRWSQRLEQAGVNGVDEAIEKVENREEVEDAEQTEQTEQTEQAERVRQAGKMVKREKRRERVGGRRQRRGGR